LTGKIEKYENKIDGIFAIERTTQSALRLALKKGFKVPEDISIVVC
jgi:LacI family transcriptional regulator